MRQISELEFDAIVNSWWRNQEFRKLMILKKIQALYESKNQSISKADLIQRVRDLEHTKVNLNNTKLWSE